MKFVSFCPHLIAGYPKDDLDESNKRIAVFIKILDFCKENSLDLMISLRVFQLFNEGFPWEMTSGNSKQKSLVLLMQSAILPKINKMSKVSHDVSSYVDFDCCYLSDGNILKIFDGFLKSFFVQTCVDGRTINALIGDRCHNYKEEIFYISLSSLEDLKKFQVTWLKVYDKNLPVKGEFPFIPPNGWESLVQKKGTQNGWIDVQGNEWKWDKLHKNHWDVQLVGGNGDYKNVSPDGRIL